MTAKEAVSIFKKTFGDRKIAFVKDYDNTHYTIEALPSNGKISIGTQTLFGVDKKTGEVTAFYLDSEKTHRQYMNAKICEV